MTGPAPYGVFSVGKGPLRLGVRSGDDIVDVTGVHELFAVGSLSPLLAAGFAAWEETRSLIEALIGETPDPDLITPLRRATMHLPFAVGDYVDFYSSHHHATNVGRLFRPDSEPLTPNWKHMPLGYHGRSGTVVVDGTPIRRPAGQRGPGDFGPSRKLDFELEVGFVTGQGPPLGTPVPVTGAEQYIFGLMLVNDWSARDLQSWEYQPLGPFLGKSFATSVSPWVIPLAGLNDHRIEAAGQDPTPLPYLLPPGRGLDLDLEVRINGEVVTRSNTKHLYWTMSQQLAHATSNGATIRAGDLFASGTISGPTPDSLGCLLEITADGQNGDYLRNGDTVVIRNGLLGECSGTVVGWGTRRQ
jgi:fumarylacetoacetase